FGRSSHDRRGSGHRHHLALGLHPRLAGRPGALARSTAGTWPARTGRTARATATTAATAALGILGCARFAHLAVDLVDAVAVLVVSRLASGTGPRRARQRHQQVRRHRLGRDPLLDEGLDVRQADRVAFAGEADRVALFAQARGAADAVHVVFGIEWQVVVVDVLHAIDVQAAGGDVGGDQDLELAGLELLQQRLALLL